MGESDTLNVLVTLLLVTASIVSSAPMPAPNTTFVDMIVSSIPSAKSCVFPLEDLKTSPVAKDIDNVCQMTAIGPGTEFACASIAGTITMLCNDKEHGQGVPKSLDSYISALEGHNVDKFCQSFSSVKNILEKVAKEYKSEHTHGSEDVSKFLMNTGPASCWNVCPSPSLQDTKVNEGVNGVCLVWRVAANLYNTLDGKQDAEERENNASEDADVNKDGNNRTPVLAEALKPAPVKKDGKQDVKSVPALGDQPKNPEILKPVQKPEPGALTQGADLSKNDVKQENTAPKQNVASSTVSGVTVFPEGFPPQVSVDESNKGETEINMDNTPDKTPVKETSPVDSSKTTNKLVPEKQLKPVNDDDAQGSPILKDDNDTEKKMPDDDYIDTAPDETMFVDKGTNGKNIDVSQTQNENGGRVDAVHLDGINSGTTVNVEFNEDTGFFGYFVIFTGIVAVLYILLHNKKKIIAYVVEGKRPHGNRRRSSNSSGGLYRKLENNFD